MGFEAVVAHQGGQPLVLGEAIGWEVVDCGRVEFHEMVELLLARTRPPVGFEVIFDQLGCGDVDLVEQAEESSLVLHVAVQDRDVGDLACCYELVGALSEEFAVGAESPGRCQTAESEEVVDRVGVLEDLRVRGLAQTGDLVGYTGTADIGDHVVEEGLLAFWTVDNQRTTRNANCSAEKTFVIAFVDYEVSRHRPRASGFSHNGDLCGVASEGLDVLLDPLHCDALIFKAEIEQTSLLELPRSGETKVVKTIVDRREQDGLAILHGSLDDIGTLVEYTGNGSLNGHTSACVGR